MILSAPFVRGKRFQWNPKAKSRPAYVCTRCKYEVQMNNAHFFTRCETCTKAAEAYERQHERKR